jgi:GWxTD domain-containing protein
MTGDEQRDWKRITTDDEAEKFVELFWARRDPTPGTPLNEFKADFEARVKDADARYASHDSIGTVITRGSMSDRGRVLMVLGYPQILNMVARDILKSDGRREIWLWERETAQPKFDLPRVEVVFVEDPKGIFHRDTQRHDFLNATPPALRKMIVGPNLKDVPDWAKPQALATAPAAPAGVAALRKGEPGAHHLILMTDPHAIVNSEAGDPFADVVTATVFAKKDDLGYALEYCGDKEKVKVSVAIRGMSDGKRVSINGLPVNAHPDPILTVPGCGLVRAAISLADLPLTPGTYSFVVKVDDGTQTYNLTQDFTIQ